MRIAVLGVVLITGCASFGGDFNAARDSWRDATYDEVVSRWGAASRSGVLSDGRMTYTWVSEGTVSRGSLFPSIGIGVGSGGFVLGTGVTLGSGGYEQVRCERTLRFRGARVVDQTWYGEAEFCNGFRRS
jgi:hypothetical protein